MIKGVLDANVVDDLLMNGRYERWSAAVAAHQLELLWTHITIDELARVPDEDRRGHLLSIAASLCRFVPTGAAVFDVSRFNMCRFASDDEAFEELRAGNVRNTQDALICATAEAELCAVISNDRRMLRRAERRGLTGWTPDDVDRRLAAGA